MLYAPPPKKDISDFPTFISLRYGNSLRNIDTAVHVNHILDDLHEHCIKHSVDRFTQQQIVKCINKQNGKDAIHEELSQLAPRKQLSINVRLPQVNIVTLQVSSEQYTPSEQSSLSGQCGSEYSYDYDMKDSDAAMFALSVSDIELGAYMDEQHDALLNTMTFLLHRHSVLNTESDLSALDHLHSLSLPSSTLINGSIKSAQLQAQHIDGNSNNMCKNVTSIPSNKSYVGFLVKLGVDVDLDTASVDLQEKEGPGNIIMEAGIQDIQLKALVKKYLDKKKPEKIGVSVSAEARSHYNEHNKLLLTPIETRKRTASDINNPLFEREKTDGCGASKLGGGLRSVKYNRFSYSQSSLESDSSSDSNQPLTQKGHISLDIDSGDIADDSDNGQDDDKVSVIFSSDGEKQNRPNVKSARYTRHSAKRQSTEAKKAESLPKEERAKISEELSGTLDLQKIWINLATPRKLKVLQGAAEQDVNLVTTLVPALSCWINPIVDLQKTVELVSSTLKRWRYAVLACLMGQALPESGRLLKKVCVYC